MLPRAPELRAGRGDEDMVALLEERRVGGIHHGDDWSSRRASHRSDGGDIRPRAGLRDRQQAGARER